MLKLQRPFSRGDPKRGNPSMTTSTVTAKRKGGPQHYVEGKMTRTILHMSFVLPEPFRTAFELTELKTGVIEIRPMWLH